MKEETNDHSNNRPSEEQMNDMHTQAWLDFQADAQQAKQKVNRRYALLLETYKTYKDMPYGVKESVKQDYNAHKEKWGENGTEQQRRFGVKETAPAKQQKETQPETEYKSIADEKEAFLNRVQQVRETQSNRRLEYER